LILKEKKVIKSWLWVLMWVVEGDIGVVIERGGLDMIVGLDEEGLIDNVSKEEGLKMFMELVGGEMVKEVEEKVKELYDMVEGLEVCDWVVGSNGEYCVMYGVVFKL
jgi:hypothetical protein